MIDENHPLNAKDPYGYSKICAEQIVSKWCEKRNIIYTILRLPLIVGNDAPGNFKLMIGAIKKGYYFNIDNGKAKKSMVLTSDIAKILPSVASIGGIYNLTDGYHPSFKELSLLIAKKLGKHVPYSLPKSLALILGHIGDLVGPNSPITTKKIYNICSELTFSDSKARSAFGWNPSSILENLNLGE